MSTQSDSLGSTMDLADMPFAVHRDHARHKPNDRAPSLALAWSCQSRESEQRIQPRFAASGLNVRIRAWRLLFWEKKGRPVECLDINRYGTAILTAHPFRNGARLRMDFRGEHITQYNINGRVKSCVQQEGGYYRLGIQFTYWSVPGDYSRAIDNALSQLEGFCRRQMARYRR